MAKRNFRGKPKRKKDRSAGPPGADMMGQIQKMQEDMAKAQEELANVTTSVTAGGGAITIEITGHQRVTGITIDAAMLELEIEADDLEMLQDMLVAGMNAAVEQSQTLSASHMEGLTGGLGLGDLLGGLGGG
jgi:hypothetical protein